MKLVCVGDSITAGQHTPAECHWTTTLGARSYGTPNETSRDGRLRIDRIPVDDADMVLIQFGHNDANRWDTLGGKRRVPVHEYRLNLETMVATCEFQGVPAMVVVPHRTTLSIEYETDLREYVKVAESFPRSFRVDVDTRHLLDGIHLNPRGHRLYAKTIRSLLVTA